MVVQLSLDILLIYIYIDIHPVVPPTTVSHVFYESYPIGSHGESHVVIPLIQVTLPPDFTERLQKCERQNQDLEAPWEHLGNHEGPTVDICDVAYYTLIYLIRYIRVF